MSLLEKTRPAFPIHTGVSSDTPAVRLLLQEQEEDRRGIPRGGMGTPEWPADDHDETEEMHEQQPYHENDEEDVFPSEPLTDEQHAQIYADGGRGHGFLYNIVAPQYEAQNRRVTTTNEPVLLETNPNLDLGYHGDPHMD